MPTRRDRLEPPLIFADVPFEVSLEGGAAAGAGYGAAGSGGAGGGGGSGGGGGGEGGGGGGSDGDTGADDGGGTGPSGAIAFVQAQQLIAPVFVVQPADQNINANDTAVFTAAATHFPAYQWQVSPDGIAPFADVVDGGIFSGARTSNLVLTNVPIQYSGYVFKCVATNTGGTDTSLTATLTVAAPPNLPVIDTDPVDTTAVAGGSASFSVTAEGSAPLVYRWQVSSDGGLTWSNVENGTPYSGADTDTLTINPVS